MKRSMSLLLAVMILLCTACSSNQAEALQETETVENVSAEEDSMETETGIEAVIINKESFEYSSEGANITAFYSHNKELQALKVEILGTLGKEQHEYSFFEEYTVYNYSQVQYEEPFYLTEDVAIQDVVQNKYMIYADQIYDVSDSENSLQLTEEKEKQMRELLQQFLKEISEGDTKEMYIDNKDVQNEAEPVNIDTVLLEADFYDAISNNPIDAAFILEDESAENRIKQAKQCSDAWMAEIENSFNVLEEYLSEEDYADLCSSYEGWKQYIDDMFAVEQKIYYVGSEYLAISDLAGGSLTYPRVMEVKAQRVRDYAIEMKALEYTFTGNVEWIYVQ